MSVDNKKTKFTMFYVTIYNCLRTDVLKLYQCYNQ